MKQESGNNAPSLYCLRAKHERVIRFMSDQVAPCCQIPGVDLKQDKIESLVEKIQTTNKAKECQKCWSAEDAGIRSHRIQGNEFWKDRNHYHLEVNYDNKCDLACIYCNQLFSSSWQSELIGRKAPQYYRNEELKNRKLTSFHESFLETQILRLAERTHQGSSAGIAILGGEPLLHTVRNTSLIDRVLELFYSKANSDTHFDLSIQTNGNTPPAILDQVIQLLNKTQQNYPALRIYIGLSAESTGQNFEYVRYGATWKRFAENLIYWSKTNFDLSIQTSINAVSLCDLKDFTSYMNQFSRDFRSLRMRFGLVTLPKGLSLSYLSRDFKVFIDEALDLLTSNTCYLKNKAELVEDYKSLIPILGSTKDPSFVKEARDIFEYIKEVRGLDLKAVAPDLDDYIKAYSRV